MTDQDNQINLDSDIQINSFINREPGTGHHKFIVKLRDLLEGITYDVQGYIFRECDNESVSEAFKREVRKTMNQILETYISKLVD
jgi:hypothetical protein